MAKNSIYPDYTPVDEPVKPMPKPKPKPAPKPEPKPEPKPKPAPQPPMYPDSVPVDEPTSSGLKRGGAVKKMASGGSFRASANGIAQRGKTRGTMVMCGGGMSKGKK